MKKVIIVLAAAAVIAAAAALILWPKEDAEAAPSPAVQVITAERGKELLDAGGVTLVDVRTASEYAAAHIPGAILVPNETITDSPPAELPDLDADIIVYCRSGRRSADAAAKLAAIGYTHVYDMGGIQSWPYETVTEG